MAPHRLRVPVPDFVALLYHNERLIKKYTLDKYMKTACFHAKVAALSANFLSRCEFQDAVKCIFEKIDNYYFRNDKVIHLLTKIMVL